MEQTDQEKKKSLSMSFFTKLLFGCAQAESKKLTFSAEALQQT
jgi:hypothetical protein